MRAFIYNKSTGKVIAEQNCGIDELNSRYEGNADFGFIEACEGISMRSCLVKGGVIVDFGEKPTPFHVLGDNGWVLGEYAIETAKRDARIRVNSERDRQESSGFLAFGKAFDSDQTAVQRISMAAQAAQLAPAEFSIEWTCQDNSTITLSRDQLIQMPLIMAQASNALHGKACMLKAQIDAATSIEEVEAVAW